MPPSNTDLTGVGAISAPQSALPADAYKIAHYTIVPRRHYGRILATVLILAVLALLIRAFAVGDIEWRYVGLFLTAPARAFSSEVDTGSLATNAKRLRGENALKQ
jgi:hypothetical protein